MMQTVINFIVLTAVLIVFTRWLFKRLIYWRK